MLSKEKRAKLQAAQGGSKIMSSRVKVQSSELIGMELTIEDYDRIGSDADEVPEDGEKETEEGEKAKAKHHYYAVAFVEIPDNYVFSGSALTKLIDGAEADGEDIRGERVRYDKPIRLDGGRSFTPVILLDN